MKVKIMNSESIKQWEKGNKNHKNKEIRKMIDKIERGIGVERRILYQWKKRWMNIQT